MTARAREHMADANALLNRISSAVDGNPLLAGIVRNASTARTMAQQMKETPASRKRLQHRHDEKQKSTDRLRVEESEDKTTAVMFEYEQLSNQSRKLRRPETK